jgi:coenzyme F420-reducing hydrogenase beta subunit
LLATIEKCTGCMACLNSCPIGCISSYMDKEGFYQPVIDEERCLGCGQCEKSCPVLQDILKKNNEKPDVYAAWNKDEKILQQSSSGGVFSNISKIVLSKGGIVFGASYNKNLEVQHIAVEKLEDLQKLQGSKYVQSDIGYSYKKVKESLFKNRYVLFTGTPCQIAGLYAFLEGDIYENLITCDLICHGVPSPGVFRKYIDYVENREHAKIISIEMRTKKNGWNSVFDMRFVFDNLKEVEINNAFNDVYMNGFLFNLYLRKSCYNCKYAKTPRESDITLADFWGIGKESPYNHPTKQGVSLVLVNSNKGKNLFELCKDDLFFEKRTLEEAKKGNAMLVQRQYINPYREHFFIDYQKKSFEHLIPIYLKRKQSLTYVLINRVVKIIGNKNIKKIKRLLGK